MRLKQYLTPKALPYAGATVQAVLFAIAGREALPAFGWLVGLGAGAVVNYSMALASSRISDVAEKRKPLARLALAGMFVISPVTITLSLSMPGSVYSDIAWAVCVDLAIILAGAIAGKSLIHESKPQKPAQRKPAAAKIRSAKIACRYAGCERTFATQNAANAHARNCSMRPTISMPVEVTKPS